MKNFLKSLELKEHKQSYYFAVKDTKGKDFGLKLSIMRSPHFINEFIAELKIRPFGLITNKAILINYSLPNEWDSLCMYAERFKIIMPREFMHKDKK